MCCWRTTDSQWAAMARSTFVVSLLHNPPLACRCDALRYSDSTLVVTGHERTSFDWLVTASKIGTEATLTILRGKEVSQPSPAHRLCR